MPGKTQSRIRTVARRLKSKSDEARKIISAQIQKDYLKRHLAQCDRVQSRLSSDIWDLTTALKRTELPQEVTDEINDALRDAEHIHNELKQHLEGLRYDNSDDDEGETDDEGSGIYSTPPSRRSSVSQTQEIRGTGGRVDDAGIETRDRVSQNEVTGTENTIQQLVQLLAEAIKDKPKAPVERLRAKLPKFEIKSFNGTLTEFVPFWDAFCASVHSHPSLSNVEKFNYLLGFLEGEAFRTLEGIPITNNNYGFALEELKSRYSNPDLVKAAHSQALLEIPKAVDNAFSLRRFYSETVKNIRALEALGEVTDTQFLINALFCKLPSSVQLELGKFKSIKEGWTIQRLLDSLNVIITNMERVELNERRNTDTGTSNTDVMLSQPRQLKAKFSSPKFYTNRPKCLFCQGDHFSDSCTKVTSLQERKAKAKSHCYRCLRTSHSARDCFSKRNCFHCKANSHHRAFCPSKYGKSSVISTSLTQVKSNSTTSEFKTETMYSSNTRVMLQTATLTLKNPVTNEKTKIRALLDTGSQRSYLTEKVAKILNLQSVKSECLEIHTFGSKSPKVLKTLVYPVQIHLANGTFIQMDVNEIDKFTSSVHSVPKEILSMIKSTNIKHNLADPIIPTEDTLPLDLLIGIDYYWELVTGKAIALHKGLYLVESKLGWIISGRTGLESKEKEKTTLLSTFLSTVDTLSQSSENFGFQSPDEYAKNKLHTDIKSLWELDTLGIKDSPCDSDDNKALEVFSGTLKYHDPRYYISWPWKENSPDLPTNYELSLGRLHTLIRKFQDNPDAYAKYCKIIEDQISKGVVEIVNDDTEVGNLHHYIPHHAVITPQKSTTKVRIVYDGSAKAHPSNASINECLYRGPITNFMANLCGLIIRFRLNSIALISDIEKAFLQVGIQTVQRDVTRFLWLKDTSKITTENNIAILRFARVPFGLICSPFLLAATVDTHLASKEQDDDIAKAIRSNVYVDNVIVSVPTVQKAKNFYKKAKSKFQAASMNLREWSSNNTEVNNYFDKADQMIESPTKVLGILWDQSEDTLKVCGSDKAVLLNTKRKILKSIASLFDPLGFYCPVTIQSKILLQELWEDKYDWDDLLPEKICQRATQYAPIGIQNHSIQRFFGMNPDDAQALQLLAFCDASDKAYVAIIYLRLEDSTKIVNNLVFAKARVIPKKSMTTPRGELLAMLIAVRSVRFIKDEIRLPMKNAIIWSDSQCVLNWISSGKSIDQFVDNRVKEIRSTQDTIFRYIHTTENPADIASRGLHAKDLLNSSLRWKGPEWLHKPSDEWPTYQFKEILPHEVKKTAELNPIIPFHQFFSFVGEGQIPLVSDFGLDETRFSTLSKLFRTTAYVLRFIENCRPSTLIKAKKSITTQEMKQSKKVWERLVQTKCFAEVQLNLMRGRKDQLIQQLGLKLDGEGIIRCVGRMANAELTETALVPKLLPNKSYFTKLIIMDVHSRLMHSGVAHTLAELRNEYWVIKGRTEVARVLRKCRTCKKWNALPYKAPDMPPFPKSRVAKDAPFKYVGIDYFGPLTIKRKNNEKVKVWACLFTCLVVRAIHLELVSDLTGDKFLLSLQRFVSRRGKPDVIYSDNATNFKFSSQLLSRFQADNQIKWHLIPEKAPWMGGFYERLIGIVKQCLKKSIGNLCLTYEHLYTCLIQAEQVVNSRPLTYIGGDISSPLSPADFLMLNPKSFTPANNEIEAIQSDDRTIIEMWKRGQNLCEQFWNMWQNQYLKSLRERYKAQLKQSKSLSTSQPRINAVVLIQDKLPRAKWKLGRIISLPTTRTAEVRLSNGNAIRRSIAMLYPLELEN